MRTMRWFFLVLGAIAINAQVITSAAAGLFKMDFGHLENVDDLGDWDVFETFVFDDFDNGVAVWPLTDWSGGGDNDVTLTIMDQEELAELTGSIALGMTANNPTHEQEDVVYDGIAVPYPVKDDYLYRNPDTAGTELLFRFDKLNPGAYNVTLFEGRTTDGSGQFGKIWVDSDITGAGEPAEENTDDFSGTLPDVDPLGHPQTIAVDIRGGQYLWYAHMEDNSGGISGIIIRQTMALEGGAALQPGDADRDLDFDQLDLVRVQVASKYLTGNPATWGEGDWNGAPGGTAAAPPAGNGRFDQVDIIAALGAGKYLTGKYAALANANGMRGDAQTSIIYNAGTGEVAVDAPAGTNLTSVNIDSAGGVFTGAPAQNLGGSFDNDSDTNIFKATFGSSFGSLSFGNVAQAGLSQQFVVNDLTVVGSLAGGGALGNVDLIYIPEPRAAVLLVLGVMGFLAIRRYRSASPT